MSRTMSYFGGWRKGTHNLRYWLSDIPEEMMKPWIAFFQKPTPDELRRRD